MENENTEVEVINERLPFEPVCPKCGAALAIECGTGGYFAKCENCNNSLREFDYYGIQPGMLVGDGECEGSC